MPNSLKKVILKVVPLIALMVLVSGCSLLPGKGSKTINLTYWGLWEPADIIDQIKNDYRKTHPNVNITYVKKNPQQYREAIQSQIQSGKGPDIFRFHNTWTPMLENELATVPSNIMSASDFKKNFYPTALADLRNSKKQLVGIPLEIDGIALFWNQDIFNAAGITKPPKTWTEFAQTAARLTVKDAQGGIRTAGAAIGETANIEHFSDILGLMILQNGGDPKTPTDQRTVDAVEYYTKFTKGENRIWDKTQPASTLAFAGGSVAMYFGPSWRVAEFKNANQYLNFKVAPVPQLEGGKVAWASYWAEGVSAKSQYKQEAWEFVKFLQEDQNLVKMYAEASKTPGRVFGEPYGKTTLASKLTGVDYVGAFIQDAQSMRSFPMASRTFDNGINDQIIKAYEDAVNSTIAGASAKSALETTSKNVTNILGRYRLQETSK